MPVRAHKSGRLLGLPFIRYNTTGNSLSWSFTLGPWSWNTRTRRHRVDLPGPFHWMQTAKPRGRTTARTSPRTTPTDPRTTRTARPATTPRGGPPNLLPRAGLCAFVAAVCGAALVMFGASFGLMALTGLSGACAGILTAEHARTHRRMKVSRFGTVTHRASTSNGGHSPQCQARSASTCRCPGRRRTAARKPAARRTTRKRAS